MSLKCSYTHKRSNARKHGYSFTLTLKEYTSLMHEKHCHYTGIKLTQRIHNKSIKSTDRTIDRIDNTKGYVTGNVVACCHMANVIKGRFEDNQDPMNMRYMFSILYNTKKSLILSKIYYLKQKMVSLFLRCYTINNNLSLTFLS